MERKWRKWDRDFQFRRRRGPKGSSSTGMFSRTCPFFLFSHGSIIFGHIRILFWCLNKSIGKFFIFLWDLSLFPCIFMLDFYSVCATLFQDLI